MKRKILLTLFVMAIALVALAISSSAAEPVKTWNVSATENDSVYAYLFEDEENEGYYTLTITGTGNMFSNTFSYTRLPWYNEGYDDLITSFTVGENVTSLSGYLFFRSKTLKEVHFNAIEMADFEISTSFYETGHEDGLTVYIGNKVTYIPKTFLYSSYTTSVVFEENSSLTTIGPDAFTSCSRLSSINLPSSLKTIGNDAFESCRALENVEIPNGVTTLGSRAFYYCGIKEIVIPDSVTNVGTGAFYGCFNLTDVSIGKGISEIVGSMFRECSSLETITVPEGIIALREGAFYSCGNLKNIYFPRSLQTIENNAFYHCGSIEEVTLYENVKTISSGAFFGVTKMEKYAVDENNPYFKSVDGCIYTKNGEKMVKYPSNKDATSFTLPSGVKYVLSYCFEDAVNLEHIDLGNEVISLGLSAFGDCWNLKDLIIPESVTLLDNFVFFNCHSLVTVEIPSGVTYIPRNAFFGCQGLKEVIIHDTMKTIGESAFANCTALERVIIPNSVTRVVSGAFYNCTAVTIYCEAFSQPSTWDGGWNPLDRPVVWGYGHEHQYTEEITKEPTHISEGEKTYTCECGEIYIEKIDKTEHNFGEWKYFDKYYHTRSCECGEVEMENHDISDGKCTLCDMVVENIAPKAEISVDTTWWGTDLKYLVDNDWSLATLIRAFQPYNVITFNWYSDCEFTKVVIGVNGTGEAPTAWQVYEKTNNDYVVKITMYDLAGNVTYQNSSNTLDIQALVLDVDCVASKMVLEITTNYNIYPIFEVEAYTTSEYNYHAHDDELIDYVAPTHNETGMSIYACTLCGRERIEEIPKLSHTYVETVVLPTCTKEGYTVHFCNTCGDTYTSDYTEKLDHDYENEICSICGNKQKYLISSSNIATLYNPDGTIVVDGLMNGGHRLPNVFDGNTSEALYQNTQGRYIIIDLNKIFVGGYYVTDVNIYHAGNTRYSLYYTSDGITWYSIAENIITEDTVYAVNQYATQIKYVFETTISWTPSLKEIEIYGEKTSNVCTHEGSMEIVTQNPTHVTVGLITYACSECGYFYEKEIPALGHSFGKWSYLDENHHQRSCECGEVEIEGHVSSDGDCPVCHGEGKNIAPFADVLFPPDVWWGVDVKYLVDGDWTLATVTAPRVRNSVYTFDWYMNYHFTEVAIGVNGTGEAPTVWQIYENTNNNLPITIVMYDMEGNVTYKYSGNTLDIQVLYLNVNCVASKMEITIENTWGLYPIFEVEAYTDDYFVPHIHNDYVVSIVEPTHTSTGSITYICNDCGRELVEEIPQIPHEYVLVEVCEPSCQNEGYNVYACECGASYNGDYTDALDHEFGEINIIYPTCCEIGMFVNTCVVCGKEFVEVTPINPEAHEADWDTYDYVAPTCISNGYESYTCALCKKEIVMVINCSTEFCLYETIEYVSATCQAAGYEKLACVLCGTEIQYELSQNEFAHVYGDGVIGDGVINYNCMICDHLYQETVYMLSIGENQIEFPVVGSSWDFEMIAGEIKAVFLAEGKFVMSSDDACITIMYANSVYELAELPYTFEVKEGEAIICFITSSDWHTFTATVIIEEQHTHNFTENVVEAPTHVSEGITEYVCACGASYTVTIPATDEHNYVVIEEYESTCGELGYIIYECECGDTYTVELELADHSAFHKIIPAIPATCMKTGWTEGVECTYCGAIVCIPEETPVNEKNHEWSAWYDTDDECINERSCKCGAKEYLEVEKDKEDNKVNAKPDKVDKDKEKNNIKIDVIFDTPTLEAIGIQIIPEIIEQLNNMETEINTDIGSVILDAIASSKLAETGSTVNIGIADVTTAKEEKQGRKVFSITVNDDNGNPILPPAQSDNNGTVTLSFKYKKGLVKEQIKIAYRDENGKLEYMEVEKYDPETGEVSFKTTHLSDYVIYVEEENPSVYLENAFTFLGYSVKEDGSNRICAGYIINYEAISMYEEATGTKLNFGAVFASYERLGGRQPLDANGNVVSLEQGKVIKQDLTDYKYATYDLVMNGIPADMLEHEFVLSMYVSTGNEVKYYQNGVANTVNGISYVNVRDTVKLEEDVI